MQIVKASTDGGAPSELRNATFTGLVYADPVAASLGTHVDGDQVTHLTAMGCDQKTQNGWFRVRAGWIAGTIGNGFGDQGERSRAMDKHLQVQSGVGNLGGKAGLVDLPEG